MDETFTSAMHLEVSQRCMKQAVEPQDLAVHIVVLDLFSVAWRLYVCAKLLRHVFVGHTMFETMLLYASLLVL
jgi:hypothetical protein